jgi:hypothetical protein
VINRFLAAHAFASWMPYHNDGVRSGLHGLWLTLAVLRAEVLRACATHVSAVDLDTLTRGIRQADLLLNHLADRRRLAAALHQHRAG